MSQIMEGELEARLFYKLLEARPYGLRSLADYKSVGIVTERIRFYELRYIRREGVPAQPCGHLCIFRQLRYSVDVYLDPVDGDISVSDVRKLQAADL